ncbi:MAG: hypothetical protein AB7I48_19115, partial [Planctomycetaceae bacterium]
MHLESTTRSKAVELINDLSAGMPLSRSAEPGLALLYQAREYARLFHQDPWEFAVEIQELKAVGLTVNDLRWLMIAELLEHACDASSAEGRPRKFTGIGRQRFSRRSCFVLTPSGLSFASRLLAGEPYSFPSTATRSLESPRVRPVWDSIRHELLLDGRIVKRFKQHSPNQEAVLTAFQEEGWPGGVLDPLTPIPKQDPKQRLRDTIKNLNRHQIDGEIHFS